MANNEDRGPMLLRTIFPLFSVAFCVYIARISIRLYQKRAFTAADYTITIAMVADAFLASFIAVAI